MTLIRTNRDNFNKFFWSTPAILDSVFDDVLWGSPIKQQKSEGIKIKEHDDKTEISIAAPGIKKEDFDVSLKEGILSISYDKSAEDNPRIFSKHAFSRSWTLPREIKTKDIFAKYDAGILTVSIKKSAKVQPKTHSIKIA